MATVDMGASSQQGKNPKPKLAVKPPMALLAAHSPASWHRSPSPDPSKSDVKDNAERERKLQLTLNGGRSSPSQIAGECDVRPIAGNVPVNIHTNHSPVSLRQGRRKTNKPPKPLPYLEPISSYVVREGRHSFVGRPSDHKRKRRVTFAKSVKYHRFRNRRATRVNREKRSKGPELAYLVVDLQSGTLVKSSDDLYQPRSESVRGTTLLQRLNSKKSPTRLRTMSVIADAKPKPKPLPRRRTGTVSPAENRGTTPEFEKKETSMITPVAKQTSDHEYQITPPTSFTQSSENTQDNISPAIKQQTKVTEKDTSLSKVIPIPRRRSLLNAYTSTKSPAPLPSTHGSDKSPPLPERTNPPPLPAKSDLTRNIQRSIKIRGNTLPREPAAEPYETPEKIELEEIDTSQNDSYGTQGTEETFSDYDNSTPFDLSEDRPEEMYIDPTQSLQLSVSGKPKPARPPPPSAIAIRRAQQKKAQSTGARKPLKSGGKHLTKQHLDPNAHRVNRSRNTAAVSHRTSHKPISTPISTPLPSEMPGDYEELDAHTDTSALPAANPWHPPPSLPSPNTSRRFSSETDIAPVLPPRSHNPTATKSLQRTKREDFKPIPSGFSHNTPGSGHRSVAKTKHATSNTGKLVSNEKSQDDSVYELIDVSMPLPPQRTKKNISGTRTTQNEEIIYPKPPPPRRQPHGKSGTAPRRSATSKSPQSSKLALRTSASFSPQLKLTKSVPTFGATGERKEANLSKEDEGGIEEYVEMHCRVEWTEEEDAPEVYVDMHPAIDNIEREEDGPSMGPYASSDLLSSRPDLKYTH